MMVKKDETIIYNTKVIDIGQQAKDFKDINMLILFGSNAPAELRSSCYIINMVPLKGTIKVGMILRIAAENYRITAVGSEVQTNLANLGHITIKFDGSTNAELPGTLHVAANLYPDIRVDDQLQIVS